MNKNRYSERCLTRRRIIKSGLYTGLGFSLPEIFGLSGCSKKPPSDRPNIILVTLDTTRADHLSCYGHDRKTSPNLDKLAEGSLVYTKAIAPSSWTLPSHASLFTGKFTSSHGARYDPDGPFYLSDALGEHPVYKRFRARGLAQDEKPLAATLKNIGYQTGAVVAGPWLKKVFGLAKGFDYYDDSQITRLNGKTANLVTDSALNWLKESHKKEFFLFLNYFDPHEPYMAPHEFLEKLVPNRILSSIPKLEAERIRYDAEILFMDHHFGRLIQKLKNMRIYDNTWIIVTADHGELLGEHGKFRHGFYLYQEEIHIPLILKYPAGEVSPAQTSVMVQLNDIYAMILDRLQIPLPNNIQASLPHNITHPILAETYPLDFPDGHWRTIIHGELKYLWNSKGRHKLFDLSNVGGEDINLIEKHPQKARELLAEMDSYLAKLPRPGPPVPARKLDTQTSEALKSLGYVK
jgi:arylsulfatase A-like enzyme